MLLQESEAHLPLQAGLYLRCFHSTRIDPLPSPSAQQLLWSCQQTAHSHQDKREQLPTPSFRFGLHQIRAH